MIIIIIIIITIIIIIKIKKKNSLFILGNNVQLKSTQNSKNTTFTLK